MHHPARHLFRHTVSLVVHMLELSEGLVRELKLNPHSGDKTQVLGPSSTLRRC